MSRIRTILEMIKFEHSVFALPFALTGALLAARYARSRRGAGLALVAASRLDHRCHGRSALLCDDHKSHHRRAL